MLLNPANLPQDPDQLRAKLMEMMAALEQKDAANNALRDERDNFKAAYEEAETERSHLRACTSPASQLLSGEQWGGCEVDGRAA